MGEVKRPSPEKLTQMVRGVMSIQEGHALADDIIQVFNDRDDYAAKVAELEAAQGWRDIKDAPKDGTVVLAYDQPNDLYVVVYWTSSLGGFWQACDDEFSPEEPTHWQHLPNRPAAPATTKEG